MHSFALIPLLAFAGIVSASPIPAPAPQLTLPLIGDVCQSLKTNVNGVLELLAKLPPGFDLALCSLPPFPRAEGAVSSVVDEFLSNAPGASILSRNDLLRRVVDAALPSPRGIPILGGLLGGTTDSLRKRGLLDDIFDKREDSSPAQPLVKLLEFTVDNGITSRSIREERAEGVSIADGLNAEVKNDLDDAEARVLKRATVASVVDLAAEEIAAALYTVDDKIRGIVNPSAEGAPIKRTDASTPQLVNTLLSLLVDHRIIDIPTAKSISLTFGTF